MTGASKNFLACLGFLFVGCSSPNVPHPDAVAAEKKAVAFLSREVPAWTRVNGCFSCHNNGDGARALYIASKYGYRFSRQVMDDTSRWLGNPAQWDKNKGDPGFSDQRLANLQFAAALAGAVDAGLIDQSNLQAAADRVARDQAPSGQWPIDRHNPVGSPVTYGSILATFMAFSVLEHSQTFTNELAATRRALETCEANNTVSAAVVLLASKRGVDFGRKTQAALSFMLASQKPGGGWGPYTDAAPESFDTALALLALKAHGNSGALSISHAIGKGRSFLVHEQLHDGSWPATTRPPGNQSYAQQVSTTAWATIALLETR